MVNLTGPFFDIQCSYPAGTPVSLLMQEHELPFRAGPLFENLDLQWGDRLWTSVRCTLRGAGNGGLCNLGLSDLQVAEEADLLLCQAPTDFALLPVVELNDALAKPAIIANFLIKRLLAKILDNQGTCPAKIGVLFCHDQHWAYLQFDAVQGHAHYYDGIPDRLLTVANQIALAFAQFFEVNVNIYPCMTLVTQMDDDCCGTLALVNLGWALRLWDCFGYLEVETWHAAIKKDNPRRGLGGYDYASVHAWLVGFLPSRGVPEPSNDLGYQLSVKQSTLNTLGNSSRVLAAQLANRLCGSLMMNFVHTLLQDHSRNMGQPLRSRDQKRSVTPSPRSLCTYLLSRSR